MQKICFVTTTLYIARPFLFDHIRALSKHYEVHLLVNLQDQYQGRVDDFKARVRHLPMGRGLSVGAALRSLMVLIPLFVRERFALVHSYAPMAGMVTMLAGWLTRRPVRIHTFAGQVWFTQRGVARAVLKGADCLIAHLATHVLADSPSQREMLIAEGIVRADKISVLGGGSIPGVDTARFAPSGEQRNHVRDELRIPRDAVVFLYVGRLKREKGVLDLAAAFADVAADWPQAVLLIVGPDEDGLEHEIHRRCGAHAARLHRAGFTQEPDKYMKAADVLCLPSYREGFGIVIIEGAACELPALASRIVGITDAVAEGEGGLLHAPGDVAGIAQIMRRYLEQPEQRRDLGRAARERVLREFSAERIQSEQMACYAKALAALSTAS
ncbi:MAG: glycosyltransferase [Nevskiales bacterium]